MNYAQSQPSVSDITERSEFPGITHFAACLGWGVLTGTLVLAAGLLIDAGFDVDASEVFVGIFFIGAFVGFFTIAAMLVIGLPLTLVLRVLGMEQAVTYAAIGTLAGFLIIAVLFGIHEEDAEMLWFPLSGALAGCACAFRWGRWREQIASQSEASAPPAPAPKHDNPIHDLIF